MYFTGIIIAAMTFLTIGLWYRHQDRILFWHSSLGDLSARWHQLLRGSTLHQQCLYLLIPWCVRCFRPMGHRRTLLSEKTRREGLVPHESQAKKEIIK